MKKNKNLFLLVATSSLVCATAVVMATKGNFGSPVVSKATESYSFVLNEANKLTEEQVAAEEVTYLTTSGNPITFAFHGATTPTQGGVHCELVGVGSYLEIKNTNMIKGITSIDYSFTTRFASAFEIYAGASKADAYTVKRYAYPGDNWHNPADTINFASPVNYIRVENIGQNYDDSDLYKVFVKSITFNYSCEENNANEIKEARSETMFYGATDNWLSGWDDEKEPRDFKCTDVATAYSGYSLHVVTTTEATGWPGVSYNLAKTYDMSDKGLSLYAKFSIMHPWISIRLRHSGENVTKQLTADVTQGSWKFIEFSNDFILSKLEDGKTVEDLKQINDILVTINCEEHKGNVQEVWLDEFHPVENYATFGQNMENIKLDDGDTNSTVTMDYTEHKGANSIASRKLTFESTTPASGYQVKVSFSTQAQYGESNPVLNNGKLSFDMKPSVNIVNNKDKDIYKHQYEPNIIEKNWTGHHDWENILPSGKGGYITSESEDGWYHVELDLSGAKYSNATTPNIRIVLKFFGVSASVKDTASINVDNLNWTPAP